ncbi:hypothetical protein ATCC90586_008570 [Pythium insidiosum]|nr:hypothetical protein ATCC90586_008570 [Pythium insidiosum]
MSVSMSAFEASLLVCWFLAAMALLGKTTPPSIQTLASGVFLLMVLLQFYFIYRAAQGEIYTANASTGR